MFVRGYFEKKARPLGRLSGKGKEGGRLERFCKTSLERSKHVLGGSHNGTERGEALASSFGARTTGDYAPDFNVAFGLAVV